MGVTDKQLIDCIQKIRERNNGNWMAILRLAFEVTPERTRAIFKDIVFCDREIQRHSKHLAKNKGK